MRRSTIVTAMLCAVAAICSMPSRARAGFIADENTRAGAAGWVPRVDGTARGTGVIDVYPAAWSVARGETVRLKVRSTASWSLHVYRVGWYGGVGARQLATRAGLSADPQAYPTASSDTGETRAGWHDSVSVPTDASWTPGLYVARVDHASGAQAATFFVVRDQGLAPRPRILVVVTTATHQAYNAWPGKSRGGKSLYGFNSSSSIPSEAIALNQAVKVSFDRPFLVGAGLADLLNYEVPYVRWLEKNGWDVAYCTDQDLHVDGGLTAGRNVVTISGHWEYVSRRMIDHVRGARDAGTNLLLLSGDTISYQVRFEDGTTRMVGYKESWRNDPEQIAGLELKAKGDLVGAMSHFRMVSRGWRNVGNPLGPGEPGMLLTGLHSAGGFGPEGPWGDLIIDAPDHWLFAGTGFAKGDRIKGVMGYEFDSAELGDPAWEPFRPAGQVVLGTIVRPSTGEKRGNSAYYRAPSGAEIVALGAVEFAWALDRFASGWGDSEDERAKRMITNALTRFTAGAPPTTVPDAGPLPPTTVPDAGPPPPMTVPDAGPPPDDAGEPSLDAISSDVSSSDANPLMDVAPSDADEAPLDASVDLADTGFSEQVDATVPVEGAAPSTEEQAGGCSVGARGIDSVWLVSALAALVARRRRSGHDHR